MDERNTSHGARWLAALAGKPTAANEPASVAVVDGELGAHRARYMAVVPDPANRFPRARGGEVGLAEGWALARLVREAVEADAGANSRRTLVAIIDVPSQAYGRTEEAYGIHQALAGAAEASIVARRQGHAVLGLIVGRAMSGGFLAHGYQANRLVALSGPDVQVHAMGKAAAARITQRSIEGVEALAERITPMAYDIESYERLGLLHARLDIAPGDVDDEAAVARVRDALIAARDDIGATRDLASRLDRGERTASVRVRERLAEQW